MFDNPPAAGSSHVPAYQEPAGPPDPMPGRGLGVMIAWIVIVAVVAFVAWRNWRGSHTEEMRDAADEVTMRMLARYEVGAHSVMSMAHRPDAEQNERKLVDNVLALAHAPKQRLEAVAVVGELSGGDAAVRLLDRDADQFARAGLGPEARSLRTIYAFGSQSLSVADREALTASTGWFGRLALSYRQPASDPIRHAVLRASTRAFLADLTFMLVLVAALVAGLTLLIVGIVLFAKGHLALAYRPVAPPSAGGPFLEAFALYLVGFVGLSWLVARQLHVAIPLVYVILLGWIGFACAWPALRGVGWAEVRRGLGWTRGRGAFYEIGAGIVAYFAGLPLMVLAVIVTMVLTRYSGEHAVHPIEFEAGGGWQSIVGLYLLACVFAPVVEETMFRGALFHHLRARHRWFPSAVGSAFIFAALHPQGWTAVPVLGSIGFIFAGIREWRGTALASAAAHALNNATFVTLLVLTLG